MIEALIIVLVLVIWLMSCAICMLVGFFIGLKGDFKVKPKTSVKREINHDEKRKAEKFQRELYNLMTFDGTPQDKID